MPVCLACGWYTNFNTIKEWYILCPISDNHTEVTFQRYTNDMPTPPHITHRGLWVGWCPRCYKALTTNTTNTLPPEYEGMFEVE